MSLTSPTFVLACLLVGMLSACGLECSLTQNELEKAATYPQSSHDEWTSNPQLEAFVHDAVKNEGAAALSAKYGMQCAPVSRETGCRDCLSCRKTIKESTLDSRESFPPALKCVDWGEVLAQVDVGPAGSIKAMTYWKTSPEARQFLAKPKRRPLIEHPIPPLPLPPE